MSPGECGLDPESVYGSGLFPKFNRDFLPKGTFVIKFASKSDHSLWRYEPNCVKCLISQCESQHRCYLHSAVLSITPAGVEFISTVTVSSLLVTNTVTCTQKNKQDAYEMVH